MTPGTFGAAHSSQDTEVLNRWPSTGAGELSVEDAGPGRGGSEALQAMEPCCSPAIWTVRPNRVVSYEC